MGKKWIIQIINHIVAIIEAVPRLSAAKNVIYTNKKKTDSILTVISFEKLTYSQRIIFRPKINDKDFFLLL